MLAQEVSLLTTSREGASSLSANIFAQLPQTIIDASWVLHSSMLDSCATEAWPNQNWPETHLETNRPEAANKVRILSHFVQLLQICNSGRVVLVLQR